MPDGDLYIPLAIVSSALLLLAAGLRAPRWCFRATRPMTVAAVALPLATLLRLPTPAIDRALHSDIGISFLLEVLSDLFLFVFCGALMCHALLANGRREMVMPVSYATLVLALFAVALFASSPASSLDEAPVSLRLLADRDQSPGLGVYTLTVAVAVLAGFGFLLHAVLSSRPETKLRQVVVMLYLLASINGLSCGLVAFASPLPGWHMQMYNIAWILSLASSLFLAVGLILNSIAGRIYDGRDCAAKNGI